MESLFGGPRCCQFLWLVVIRYSIDRFNIILSDQKVFFHAFPYIRKQIAPFFIIPRVAHPVADLQMVNVLTILISNSKLKGMLASCHLLICANVPQFKFNCVIGLPLNWLEIPSIISIWIWSISNATMKYYATYLVRVIYRSCRCW